MALTAGHCLACELRRWSRFVHRELVCLVILVALSAGAFFVTRAVAQGNEALHRHQSSYWFAAAQRALQQGDPESALGALRRAALRNPRNPRYRLALAEMLSAAGRDVEARRVLVALRDAAPEDPEVNLQLARIEARAAEADAARRYYQAAIAGLWSPAHSEQRRRVRMELIDFLLTRDERARALSELFALETRLPDDAPLQARVGHLFLAAGDPRVALQHFNWALRSDADNPAALAGAGEAAFLLGDYARALPRLDAVASTNPHAATLRDVAALVLHEDPLAPRLSVSARRARGVAALRQVTARLNDCAAPTTSGDSAVAALRAQAEALAADFGRAPASRVRDLADDVLHLVARIEALTVDGCARPPTAFDRALLLIARRHGIEAL